MTAGLGDREMGEQAEPQPAHGQAPHREPPRQGRDAEPDRPRRMGRQACELPASRPAGARARNRGLGRMGGPGTPRFLRRLRSEPPANRRVLFPRRPGLPCRRLSQALAGTDRGARAGALEFVFRNGDRPDGHLTPQDDETVARAILRTSDTRAARAIGADRPSRQLPRHAADSRPSLFAPRRFTYAAADRRRRPGLPALDGRGDGFRASGRRGAAFRAPRRCDRATAPDRGARRTGPRAARGDPAAHG